MLFYAEKNHCLYACQSSWNDKSPVMRIPVGAAGHVDGEQYPTNYTPRKMHILASRAEMIDLNREINVMGIQYRLEISNLRIKHLAQAAKTTTTTSGKAAKGQLSWQTFQKFDLLGDLAYSWYELIGQSPDWRKIQNEPYKDPRDINAGNGWTCPECGAVNDADSGECDCGTTYDGPGGEESGEPIEGEILPPCAETTTAVQKATTGSLLGISKITAIIHDDLAEIGHLEEQAVNRAIRIGIMQEMAKRLLPHGEFNKWREQEFDKSISTLKYYHLLALARLAEVGLLQGHDKATPMQIPLPRDLNGLTTDTLIPEKYSQQVFDWGDDAPGSINAAYERYGVKVGQKRRGGDHGGGAARARAAQNEAQNRIQIAGMIWNDIIRGLRKFVLEEHQHNYLQPADLVIGRQAILDVLKELPKEV